MTNDDTIDGWMDGWWHLDTCSPNFGRPNVSYPTLPYRALPPLFLVLLLLLQPVIEYQIRTARDQSSTQYQHRILHDDPSSTTNETTKPLRFNKQHHAKQQQQRGNHKTAKATSKGGTNKRTKRREDLCRQHYSALYNIYIYILARRAISQISSTQM